MKKIKFHFVIGQISEGDFELLVGEHKVTCKMIIPLEDFHVFHYRVNDRIQVETNEGNRLWCNILQLDIIEESDQVLLIFTLKKSK